MNSSWNSGGGSSNRKLMRINKYLAKCGVASRRKTEELIASGQVAVNDKIVTDFSFQVSENDVVMCQNSLVTPITRIYYLMLNKPKGYITTSNDEKGRPTVMDLIPEKYKRAGVFSVGRLDKDTEGLLLLTNDGMLANYLSNPKNMVEKEYMAELDRPLDLNDKKKIEAGVFIHQLMLKTGRSKIETLPFSANHVIMKINEGKKRQIRYTFKNFNYNVLKLRRTSYGPLSIKGTAKGQVRELRDNEIRKLKAMMPVP